MDTRLSYYRLQYVEMIVDTEQKILGELIAWALPTVDINERA